MGWRKTVITIVALLALLGGIACGPKSKAKSKVSAAQAPTPGRDKELFEQSLKSFQKGRYTEGRLTLNTLVNAYAESPFLPLARLLMADSYFREGGTSNLAQAESEYQNWISFFSSTQPALSAEVMYKIAEIHIRQMSAPDRSQEEAHRAERTLMQLVSRYPDSPKVKDAQERLKDVREFLAEHDFTVATFYMEQRSAWAGAEDRLKEILEKYPDFSKLDEVLYKLGYVEIQREDTVQAGKYFADLAKRFPNSIYFDKSADYLKKFDMKVPVADANAPAARPKAGMVDKIKERVFDPSIQTSTEGIVLKKNGEPDPTVVAELQKANDLWTRTPSSVTTTVGATPDGTTKPANSTQPGNKNASGTVTVGVDPNQKPPEKKP